MARKRHFLSSKKRRQLQLIIEGLLILIVVIAALTFGIRKLSQRSNTASSQSQEKTENKDDKDNEGKKSKKNSKKNNSTDQEMDSDTKEKSNADSDSVDTTKEDTTFGDTIEDANADEATINETVSYLTENSYPQDLIEFYQKYPETKKYVLAYKDHEGDAAETNPVIDISGDVKVGEIPHFLQWDSRWGYRNYGDRLMAINGCGPTCLAMIYCGLRGASDQNPYTIAQWSLSNGLYHEDEGTDWELFTVGAKHFGLNAQEQDPDQATLEADLTAGNPVICSVKPGDFTYEGHFIVLAGYNDDGSVKVLDPNSNKNTEKGWQIDELIAQIKTMWVYSAQ